MNRFPLAVLGHVSVFTELGMRFWDDAFERPIAHELHAFAVRRRSQPGSPGPADLGPSTLAPVRAIRSPGGVYSFHDLPGRVGAGRPPQGSSPAFGPPPAEFTVVVEDPAEQFLPVTFTVALPLGSLGEFPGRDSSGLPDGRSRVYLYSSPTRRPPAGSAVVRGDLEDVATSAPAAWAVVRTMIGGLDCTAIADERGRFELVAPMPTLGQLALGSPPGSAAGGLGEVATVVLTVDYAPATLQYPLTEAIDLPGRWRSLPSLASILAQSAADILVEEGQPAAPHIEERLSYDAPLVLRTVVPSGEEPSPTLRIQAGSSSP